MSTAPADEIWITGIGLISSLGEGLDAHWQVMAEGADRAAPIDTTRFAPFPVYPMAPLELDKQIPRRADQRQMETWQRLGTYAAGLALDDSGLKGDLDRLSRMDMIVAAGGGERDLEVDGQILAGLAQGADETFLNERLINDLRPTLFLAQLSNLLAGNIAIVHKVTGSSRTFMGEESAGISAVEIAARRIRAGQGEVFLVGGAYNAERKDMLLSLALGHMLWQGGDVPVWARAASGNGGVVTGSVGAFLVIESRAHAEARGKRPHARLASVLSGRSRRKPGEARAVAERQLAELAPLLGSEPLAVVSGASGLAAPTLEERAFHEGLIADGRVAAVRAPQSWIGNSLETTFPAQVGLAALAVSRQGFYLPKGDAAIERPFDGAPRQVLTTSWGFWRGEGMALVEAVD
ncbi:3-oxoacyl-[acyl-carrier-protein] synthase II [Kaistia hirudinis]|uniref:3-oxoacyl-[acyl-carrier-protein] synthase II n=1 Tax=Kaistia hirudinis TaxID=1293440 RepID=A0A840APR9_9HYPH|nr:beta-ketoacyl-ACP synthase [Kaistia hirudinis]MBB3931273.1 3-oxoacyl-[acyl-carrier-protein] synthase II [Kaistia hirudinis]